MSIIGPEVQFVRESSETETKTRRGLTIKSALFHSNCVRAATQFRPGGTAICQLSNFDSKTILKFVDYFYENLVIFLDI